MCLHLCPNFFFSQRQESFRLGSTLMTTFHWITFVRTPFSTKVWGAGSLEGDIIQPIIPLALAYLIEFMSFQSPPSHSVLDIMNYVVAAAAALPLFFIHFHLIILHTRVTAPGILSAHLLPLFTPSRHSGPWANLSLQIYLSMSAVPK